jgi:Mg2+/Co2+ transporter CorB
MAERIGSCPCGLKSFGHVSLFVPLFRIENGGSVMDSVPILLPVSLLVILVGASAFFSGSETALFGLSRARLLAFRSATGFGPKCVTRLMDAYHETLIVLILGNMFVNTLIAIVEDELMLGFGWSPVPTTIASIVTVIFLIVLWIFSGIETGLISIRRPRAQRGLEKGIKGADIIDFFLNHPSILLATTLLGTNICHVCACAL